MSVRATTEVTCMNQIVSMHCQTLVIILEAAIVSRKMEQLWASRIRKGF